MAIADSSTIDTVAEYIGEVQVVILFALIATISYGLGWGRSNKAAIENVPTNSVTGGQPVQPELVPGWVEPTAILLAILFLVTVLVDVYSLIRRGDADLPELPV